MQKSNRFVRFLSLALGVLMMFSAFASAADALPVSPAPEAEDPSDSPLTAPDAEYTVYHGPVTELSSDDKGLWIEVDTGLGHRFLVQADIPVVNGGNCRRHEGLRSQRRRRNLCHPSCKQPHDDEHPRHLLERRYDRHKPRQAQL